MKLYPQCNWVTFFASWTATDNPNHHPWEWSRRGYRNSAWWTQESGGVEPHSEGISHLILTELIKWILLYLSYGSAARSCLYIKIKTLPIGADYWTYRFPLCMISMAHTNNMYITVIFKFSRDRNNSWSSCCDCNLNIMFTWYLFLELSEISDRVDLILKRRLRYKPRM